MYVYLAICSSKWGDDYTNYGVCGSRELAVQRLLENMSRQTETKNVIYDKLMKEGEYAIRSDIYRVEEWEVEV